MARSCKFSNIIERFFEGVDSYDCANLKFSYLYVKDGQFSTDFSSFRLRISIDSGEIY